MQRAQWQRRVCCRRVALRHSRGVRWVLVSLCVCKRACVWVCARAGAAVCELVCVPAGACGVTRAQVCMQRPPPTHPPTFPTPTLLGRRELQPVHQLLRAPDEQRLGRERRLRAPQRRRQLRMPRQEGVIAQPTCTGCEAARARHSEGAAAWGAGGGANALTAGEGSERWASQQWVSSSGRLAAAGMQGGACWAAACRMHVLQLFNRGSGEGGGIVCAHRSARLPAPRA